MKRNVPIALGLIIGLVMMTTYFFPFMDDVYRLVLQWSPVISGFAVALSIVSFVMSHWMKIRRRSPGRAYNMLALASFAIMLLAGGLRGLFPESKMFSFLGDIWGEPEESPFQWMFQSILQPMEATVFALLAFYIASASFRAFRARNVEATLLLVAATLVMIGRIPLGEAIWSGFGPLQEWIMEFPNTAAKRAITIGVGLGIAATSLKLMLGIERSYLGKGD
jgi:hypothetical protein